jgi:transposase-like protein
MPRNYKSKGLRSQWSLENLQKAVNDVLMYNKSEKSAAATFGVPRQTLRRHLKKAKNGLGVEKTIGRPRILSAQHEDELVDVIIDMERRLFGLTKMDVRKLAYRYCEANGILHNFNRESEAAGEDWMLSFMKNHPQLSLRKPEATSLARASGFNKEKVRLFFDTYESVLFNKNGSIAIPPSRIFNADESGYSVCHTPGKIIAPKGKRSVGAVTSQEKGKTITVLCCMNAAGMFVPPMIIYPRVRMKPSFMDRAPTGALGVASKTGWINEQLFTAWFDHFLKITQPASCDTPTLLIVDGHSSHIKNFDVIIKARANNVIILCLPSHCTHKLQPLDVSFFKSLNARYNAVVQTWHRQHPGRPVTEFEFGELFASAYNDVASVAKAESGFRKTGIHPFNRNIFSDDDFVAAEATNREQNPNCQQLHIEPSDHLPEDQPTSAPEVNCLMSSDQD